jgi:3-dehydroquinate dehydratase-1
MQRPQFVFPSPSPLVVGSIGDAEALARSTPVSLALQCDIAEVRLDLFHAEFHEQGSSLWQHLMPFPLLFTARCHAEGSPFDLDLATRDAMLRSAIPDACLIDIEATSASAMSDLISEVVSEGIPWVASYHDFERLPSGQKLSTHAEIAREAGASAFKAAARLRTMDDLTALAHFQMSDCGIPLSTMGMGVLAPVSRLLCAQAGSVLNYGFIGETSTAPGQWSAQQLRDSIRSLNPFR